MSDTENENATHGGGVDRKFPHMYDGQGGNGHFQGKFISGEYSSSHGDEDYRAGVGFSTVGEPEINIQAGVSHDELDVGTLTSLTPDQAREFANSILEAVKHVEEDR